MRGSSVSHDLILTARRLDGFVRTRILLEPRSGITIREASHENRTGSQITPKWQKSNGLQWRPGELRCLQITMRLRFQLTGAITA